MTQRERFEDSRRFQKEVLSEDRSHGSGRDALRDERVEKYTGNKLTLTHSHTRLHTSSHTDTNMLTHRHQHAHTHTTPHQLTHIDPHAHTHTHTRHISHMCCGQEGQKEQD